MQHKLSAIDYLSYLQDHHLIEAKQSNEVQKFLLKNAKQGSLPFIFTYWQALEP
jgi:hypothetical protein